MVNPVRLFLSLSLRPVFRQKPLPIALLAVAGHCQNGEGQWPTQFLLLSEVADLIMASSDWSQTMKNEANHLQQVCIPVGCIPANG